MAKTMPAQKPGESKQDYESPSDLLGAVIHRFGSLHVDLACTERNKKAPIAVTPEKDSLRLDWLFEFGSQRCWLNPPYEEIGPWAERCSRYGAKADLGRIFFLVPASVGTEWFRHHVWQRSYVLFLNPRVTFVGCIAPYPKDCMIAVYGAGVSGAEVWRWK